MGMSMDKIKALWGGLFVGVFLVGAQVVNAVDFASLIVNTSGSSVGICSQSMQNCSINVAPNSCLTPPGSVSITNNSPIVAKNISASSTDANFLTYVVQNNGCPASLYKGQSCTISFYTNTALAFLVPNILVKGSNTNATAFDMNAITCTPPPVTYTIGGTVSGLAGTLVLQNNGGDSQTLTANGPFTFSTPVTAGGSYNVTVQTQPATQICTVSNGSGTVSANVTNVDVVCQNQYAYVADIMGLAIDQCTVNADGSFATCTPTFTSSMWEGPFGITFATAANGTQYGYVAASSMFQCQVNTNGSFAGCSLLSPTFSPISWAGATASIFATVNGIQYGYVVDGGNGIYQCTLNTDGTFDTCTFLTSSAPSFAHGLAFATVTGIQYAYLAGNDTVYQCTMSIGGIDNGSFDTCTPSAASIPGASSVTLATVNGTQYAYATSNSSDNIYQCTVNAVGGSLGACTSMTPVLSPSTPAWSSSRAIAFATFGGVQYAYVANDNGNVYQCTLNAADGTFNTCTLTPSSSTPSWIPSAIAFAAF